MKRIELLSPARDLTAGKAAVDHGADAVYIGGPSFGARQAAGNSVHDIEELVRYGRRFGVRTYAALNTLVLPQELDRAETTARQLIEAGVDALIIQDMCFLRMGLEGVEFHASTQTAITTPEKAVFLAGAGFSRLILERGLSIAEIKDIASAADTEIECFVHGAICVGHSGRCYLSRTMGSRSGNRGNCAQSCRMKYDLLDMEGNVLIKEKHLLSVRDLDLGRHVGELLDAGVTSFKIEGRLKDDTYVKNITAHYRRLIDQVLEGKAGMARSSYGTSTPAFAPDPARSFSRGSTNWMLHGRKAERAVFDTPKAVGEEVGQVKLVTGDSFTISGHETFTPGDGICYFMGGELRGTNVNRAVNDRIWPNRMDGLVPGTTVYRNFDKSFNDAVARSEGIRTLSAKASIIISGHRIGLSVESEAGHRATVSASGSFETALNPESTRETIVKQLRKTGGTIFRIDQVDVEYEGPVPHLPVSFLNRLRRECLDVLGEKAALTPGRRATKKELHGIAYPYPDEGAYLNITNPLAAEFYRSHGVGNIVPGPEEGVLPTDLTVMVTPYCLRRETGRCDKRNISANKPLLLGHRSRSYLLEFDCAECIMRIKTMNDGQ